MPPADPRLEWYAAALDELAAFLLSPSITWPVPHAPARFHQELSLGGLLLVQDELRAFAASLSAGDRQRLRDLESRWEAARDEQPSALARKAAREIEMRVHLWAAYLADLAEQPPSRSEYAQQARHRAMIERLGDLASAPSAMEPIDRSLRERFQPGAFVWAAELAGGYPADRFWFLYGAPSPPSHAR
jgi:hypothetical protein